MAGSLSKKYGGVPLWGYLGAGTVIIGGVLYVRNKNKKAAAAAAAGGTGASTAGSTAGTGAATTAYGPAGGGGIGSDTLAAILASQQTGTTATGTATTTTAPAPWAAPTGEVLSGGGYIGGDPSQVGNPAVATAIQAPITDANGATYVHIATGQQLQALAAASIPAYFQPAPGVFTVAPANLPSGTALYQQVPA